MVNKLAGLTALALLTLLFVTKSLYVEWNELFFTIGAITIFSVIYNIKNQSSNAHLFGTSAISGFILCIVFGIVDLTLDHFLYYLPNVNNDGGALTLGFKIVEYNDDLFVASFLGMIVVITLSFALTKIFTTVLSKTA